MLHYDGSNQSAPPVGALLSAFSSGRSVFPSNVSITFPGSGDTIDDTTGDLTGVWSSPDGGTITGTGAGTAAAGVGACITWTTGGIVPGKKGPRKLRGRTFLVPLFGNCFDSDGTIEPTTLANLRSLADGIMASGPLAVWHRPTSATATDGTSYGVLSNNVRDKVAFLSSRRD